MAEDQELISDIQLEKKERLLFGHGGPKPFVPIPSTASPAYQYMDIWAARFGDVGDPAAAIEEDGLTDDPTSDQIQEALEAQAEADAEAYFDGLDEYVAQVNEWHELMGYRMTDEQFIAQQEADAEEIRRAKCGQSYFSNSRIDLELARRETLRKKGVAGFDFGTPKRFADTSMVAERLHDCAGSPAEEDPITSEPTNDQIQEALELHGEVDEDECWYVRDDVWWYWKGRVLGYVSPDYSDADENLYAYLKNILTEVEIRDRTIHELFRKCGDYDRTLPTTEAESDEPSDESCAVSEDLQEMLRLQDEARFAAIEEHTLSTVAYYYGLGYFDHHDRSRLAFGCTPEDIDQMTQQMHDETKEEREDRLIRLGCPCAENLKELRKKRLKVSPDEAEALDVEFGASYGYPNLLIISERDRIRLGCAKLTDGDSCAVVAEDSITQEPTPEEIHVAMEAQAAADAEAEVLAVIRDDDWWYWKVKIPECFPGYCPTDAEDLKRCIREIRERAASGSGILEGVTMEQCN